MILILGTISIVAFMVYFYAIGMGYVGLVPLLVLVITLVYYVSKVSLRFNSMNIVQEYGLYIAWMVVMLGLLGLLDFFGIAIIDASLFLVILNILLWIGSYLFHYDDGKSIAQLGYYVSILLLLVSVGILFGFKVFFVVFSMMWVLSLAIVAFIVFVVGIKYSIEKYVYYKLFLFFMGAIGLLLYHKISNIYVFLIISLLMLGLLYTGIGYVISHKPPTETEKKNISVRRILQGERVLKYRSKYDIVSSWIYDFTINMPKYIKFFLEGANITVILLIIYLYAKNALSLQGSTQQIFYWVITAGFVANVFLLKKIQYTSIIQRFLTFVVINFAIYISLFSAFNGDLSSIVFLGIIRNIICAMLVFHIHKTRIGVYLKKVDYLFWIFTTVLAMVVNVILLIRAGIVGQLLFPIILLYIGIQGMILYYSIKYINKIKEVPI